LKLEDFDMKKNNVSSVAFRVSLSSLLFCIFCFQDVQAKPRKAPQKQQSDQTVKQPPKPTDAVRKGVRCPLEKAFAEMISNVRRTEELNSTEKGVFEEGIHLLARTERGKWLICHAPQNMKFKKLPKYASPSGLFDTGLCISMNERHFDAVSSSQTPASRQRALYNMVTTFAHEMTHACQHNFAVFEIQGASTPDETVIFKLAELQAVLEAREVGDQLLELPAFRDFRKKEPRRYSESLLRKITERKKRDAVPSATVRRWVRTEFIKTYWRNNSNPSGPDKVVFSDYKISGWNAIYDDEYFFRMGKNIYKENGVSIDDILRNAASFMQVDIEPEFFKREKAFRYEHGRLIGYANGIKSHEIDFLTVGRIRKTYKDGLLRLVFLNVERPQTGSFKDYWHGTRRIRAAYTTEDKQAVGVYREYDYTGNQVAEIPFKDGRANGTGWFFERGQRVPKRFSNGGCYNINEKGTGPISLQEIIRIQERRRKIRSD